jgi:hypothetical protein
VVSIKHVNTLWATMQRSWILLHITLSLSLVSGVALYCIVDIRRCYGEFGKNKVIQL